MYSLYYINAVNDCKTFIPLNAQKFNEIWILLNAGENEADFNRSWLANLFFIQFRGDNIY